MSERPPALSTWPGRKRAAKSISGSWRMICTSSTILSGGGSRKTGGILPPAGSPADSRETNSGGGAPAGNLNAEKDGAYSRIFFDKLTPAEQDAFDTAPRNGVEALQHEMGLLKLRELKILEKIKEYEDMNPDTLITSSVLDMRVPGKTGKGGKKEDGKVQTMGMYSRDTPFARILKLQDALYKTQGRIAAVAGALRAAEEADRRMELEKQRLELLRIRATGEVPEDGDRDGLVHD